MSITKLPPGKTVPMPEIPASAAETAVIGFIVVVALYFGQAVFVPLALAVILSFILAPPVRILRRVGLPRPASVVLAVVLAFAVIFSVGALITQQIANLAAEMPRYQLTLTEKVKALKLVAAGNGGAFERASATLKNLQEELDKPEGPATPPAQVTVAPLNNGTISGNGRPIPVEVHNPSPTAFDQLQGIIGVVIAPLATTGVVILFVLFLLLQREDVRDRAIRLLGSHDLEKSTVAMDDAGERLSQYFLTQTGINAVYGLCIGAALWMIGVPSPVLWGVVAMLMRFVPFIGAFIAAALPLVLAAAVDPGWTMFLWTLGLYLVGEMVMGNIIEPVIQGQRTGLSPLAVVLSAAFWTLLWGPIGLLLAIPLTVVLVVLGRHVDRLSFLNVLLGDTPPLTPPERFYQRMLAGDPAEPVEQAEKFIKERPLYDYYDDVVVEGLRLAQANSDRGTLEPERLVEILDTAEIVVDALSEHAIAPKKSKRAEAAEAAKADELINSAESAEEEAEKVVVGGNFNPELIPAAWRGENAVLCVANRTPLDEAAAFLLAQLLGKCGISAKVLGPGEAKLGSLRRDYVSGIQLICLSALDADERSAHARFLIRRLSRSAPDALLIAGLWKLDMSQGRGKGLVDNADVDKIVHTMKDALAFCLQAAMASAPPDVPEAPPEGQVSVDDEAGAALARATASMAVDHPPA